MTTAKGVRRGFKRTRSRISNGSQLLPSVNPHSTWARLFRDEQERLIEHCGGEGMITEPRRLAARRTAVLEAELVHQEDRIGLMRQRGEEPEAHMIDLYCKLANAQRRACEVLGWERTQRDITPPLHQYLAEKQAAATPAVDVVAEQVPDALAKAEEEPEKA